MKYVLDSCALLAYLLAESGADEVEELLLRSNKDGIHMQFIR